MPNIDVGALAEADHLASKEKWGKCPREDGVDKPERGPHHRVWAEMVARHYDTLVDDNPIEEAKAPRSITIREGYFGPWFDGFERGDLVIVAVRKYGTEPRRVLLPHQVYVKDVLALANEGEVLVLTGVPSVREWVRVDEMARAYVEAQAAV